MKITINNISKWFGKNQVLKDISMEIESSLVICGPSGSGKSTLARCVNGLEKVQQGSIFVGDFEITSSKINISQLRQKVGMVFQAYNLFPHMKIIDNLTLAPLKVLKWSKEEAVEKAKLLLEKVGIPDKADAYPDQLSGGQRQRGAIARALVMEPDVIIFDEPTSALDPEMIQEVLDVMKGLVKDGITLIVITHEMGFAKEVASNIAFMDNGQLIEYAPPDQFFNNPESARIRDFLQKVLM